MDTHIQIQRESERQKENLNVPMHDTIFVKVIKSQQQLFCVHSYNLSEKCSIRITQLKRTQMKSLETDDHLQPQGMTRISLVGMRLNLRKQTLTGYLEFLPLSQFLNISEKNCQYNEKERYISE